jgi:hypothetical protein
MDSIMLDIAKRSGFVSARSGLESSKSVVLSTAVTTN